LRKYGYLITTPKLAEGDDFKQWVSPNIMAVTSVLGDPNLRLVPKGDRLQLERRGYFIVEQPYLAFDPSKPMVLIQIPDGHKEDSASQTEGKKKGTNNPPASQ